MLEKQSKIQLTKEEFKKIEKKVHDEEKMSRTVDFKTQKKNISHQIDLLEKNVTNCDEDKIQKAQRMLGVLMLDLILEDFLMKEYNVPSQKKMDIAMTKYREMENVAGWRKTTIN